MARAGCQRPGDCAAGARGHCRVCHADAIAAARRGRDAYWTPERRAAQSERMKAQHADPAFAALHAENSRQVMRRHHADPEKARRHRERARATMLRLRRGPAFEARRAAGRRGKSDPA